MMQIIAKISLVMTLSVYSFSCLCGVIATTTTTTSESVLAVSVASESNIRIQHELEGYILLNQHTNSKRDSSSTILKKIKTKKYHQHGGGSSLELDRMWRSTTIESNVDMDKQPPSSYGGGSSSRQLKQRKLKDSKKKMGGKGDVISDDEFDNPDLCIVRESVIVLQRNTGNRKRKNKRQLVDVSFITKQLQQVDQYDMLSKKNAKLDTKAETASSATSKITLDSRGWDFDIAQKAVASNNGRHLQQQTFPPPPEWAMPYPYCDENDIVPSSDPVPVPVPTQGDVPSPTVIMNPVQPPAPVPSDGNEIPPAVQSPSIPTNGNVPTTPAPVSGPAPAPVGSPTNGGKTPNVPVSTISPNPTVSPDSASSIDCAGIANGTASVSGYYYDEFLITINVGGGGNSTNTTSAASDLQEHLQRNVATSMAGCNDDSTVSPPTIIQETNTTIRNVIFYVNKNVKKLSSVSTKQGGGSSSAGTNTSIISTIVEVYYTTTPDTNETIISETTKGLQQFLYDSVVDQCPDFANISAVDCPTISVALLSRQPDGNGSSGGGGSGSGNGDGNSTNGGPGLVEDSKQSKSIQSGGIVGIILAGMVILALLVIFFMQRRDQTEETSSLQHIKLVDDDDPKEQDRYLEDMEIATNSVHSDSPPRPGPSSSSATGFHVIVLNDEIEVDDDESLPSARWELTPATTTKSSRYAPSLEPPPDTNRIVPPSQTLLANQDVHHCNSATCTICIERRRLEALDVSSIYASPATEDLSISSSTQARKPWRNASEVRFIPSSFGLQASSTPTTPPRTSRSLKSPRRGDLLPTSKQDDQRDYYADDTVDL